MRGRALGSVVGAVGGLVFVLVNAGALPGAPVLRVLAAVLFAVVLLLALRVRDPGPPPSRQALRVYGFCVLAEVLAIPAGAAVLRALDRPELVPVWVVLVLGVHFVPFARAFAAPVFAVLGWALVGVAVVGALVTLATGDGDAAPATASVAGFVLLGFSLYGVRPGPRQA